MRARAPWRVPGVLGVVALAGTSLVPLLALVPAALTSPETVSGALSARRLGLLLVSARLAVSVMVIDTVVAALAVAWAVSAPRRAGFAAMAVALAAAFIPPVAHGAAWAGIAEALRRVLDAPVSPLSGIFAAVLAQSSAYLPVAIVVALAGVTAVDPALIDAARVCRDDTHALRRVLLPLAAPAVLAGGGIAAVLSLGDEAVPATFGVATAAMELFASYAADGDPGAVLLLAWPLALLAGAVALASGSVIRRVALRPARGRGVWSVPPSFGAGTRVALAGGGIAAVASALLVLAALVAGTGGPGSGLAAVAAAAPDIGTTLWVAAAVALIAAAVALLAGLPAAPGASFPAPVWALALGAVVVPAPVMGAGIVATLNGPATAALYDSPAVLVVAGLARFAPLAALVLGLAARTLDREVLEAALCSGTPRRAVTRVLWPQLARPAMAGGLVAGAFAAGELGATLMVVPPGTSTAVVRAFNLLHYGASSDVAAIALTVAAIACAAAGGAAWALAGGW